MSSSVKLLILKREPVFAINIFINHNSSNSYDVQITQIFMKVLKHQYIYTKSLI